MHRHVIRAIFRHWSGHALTPDRCAESRSQTGNRVCSRKSTRKANSAAQECRLQLRLNRLNITEGNLEVHEPPRSSMSKRDSMEVLVYVCRLDTGDSVHQDGRFKGDEAILGQVTFRAPCPKLEQQESKLGGLLNSLSLSLARCHDGLCACHRPLKATRWKHWLQFWSENTLATCRPGRSNTGYTW